MSNVNAYGAATAARAGTEIDGGNKYQRKVDGSKLDMQDFLNLLTTQLANQDAMNPSNDTEFIAQMAQFSSLQAMQTLTEIQYAQYGASMVGKVVLVASVNERGELIEKTGVVSKVQMLGGSCTITVGDEDYDMSAVMNIYSEMPKPDPEPDNPDAVIPDPENPDADGGTDGTEK